MVASWQAPLVDKPFTYVMVDTKQKLPDFKTQSASIAT